MKKFSALRKALVLVASGTLVGCYTQFGSILDKQDEVARGDARLMDSTRARVDTVRVKEREVCYWSRDLLGYPVLRCDRSYYPRDWYVYHSSPWWYRNDAFWYDYDRCPRYYYFDPACGCCRYYTDAPVYRPPTGGGGSGGGVTSRPAPARSRGYGVPNQTPSSSPSASQPKSSATTEPSRPATPDHVAPPPRSRSTGVAQSSSPPQPSPQPSTPVPVAKDAADAAQNQPTPTADTAKVMPPTQPPRRSPRSW